MSDPHLAEEPVDAGGEQLRVRQLANADDGGGSAAQETVDQEVTGRASASAGSRQASALAWAEVVDSLIGWAVARADAAVDEIFAYLADRPPIRPWQGKYPREAFPFRGRGHDQVCSAMRRRLRLRQTWTPRPMGVVRPPRRRRVP